MKKITHSLHPRCYISSGFLNVWGILLMTLLFYQSSFSQTVLINPSTDGGFENGATLAANGWTSVNAVTDGWVVGSVPVVATGSNCAYVSANAGTSWTYSQVSTFTHIYRDVTIPAGEVKMNLSFKWKANGEGSATSDWDNLKVWLAPVSYTPTTGSQVTGATQLIGPGANNGMYKLSSSSWNSEAMQLVGVPGTTYRLIFSWKSDITDIANPPAALDDISLVTSAPGNYITIASGNWSDPLIWDSGVVPGSLDNATVSTGHTVVINATGSSTKDLTVNGTLNYGTVPASFSVAGNLLVNSGGALNVFNGSTGKTINVAGNFTNNGTVDLSVGATTAGNLTLNGSALQTLSGSGTFVNAKIRNLTCSNTSTAIPNIDWQINNLSVEYNLNISNAKINLGTNKFTHGISTTVHTGIGTFSFTNGGFIGGKFSRWWSTGATGYTTSGPTSIPTGAAGRYPFYTLDGQQRILYVGRTTPTVGGEYAVVYTNSSTVTSGLSIADGAYTVTDRWNGYFQVSTEGTSPVAASYWTSIFAPNVYYQLNGTGRVLGQSAAISGTHLNSTAGASAQRSGVLEADLLSATGLYMGINSADLLFASVASGDWNNPATWNKGMVPSCTDVVTVSFGTNVTVNSTANVVKDLTIAAGGQLTVASGDLTVGCTLNNNFLVNNGTLTINGGTLTLNGRFDMNSGANLNQSGGSFVVDGNDAGIVANSVASATPIFRIGNATTSYSTGTIALTGGEIVIVDPHTATTNTNGYAFYVYFPNTMNVEAGAAHSFKFGNGVSVDAGGNTSGFYVDPYVSSGRFNFGNLIVNNPSGTNRDVVTPFQIGVNGNSSVLAGNFAPSAMVLKGNLSVTGTYIATGLLHLAQPAGTGSVVNTTAQAISVTAPGVIKNLAASDTANLSTFTVNNSAGVTLNTPISVSGAITLTAGLVNTTTTNLLTAGTTTAAGSISAGSATAYVNGPLAIVIASGNTSYINYPVGKGTFAPIALAPTTTAVSKFKAETFDSNSGSSDVSIVALSNSRRWEASLLAGTYTDINVRLTDAGLVTTSIPVQAPSVAGPYSNAFGSLATYVAGPPATTRSNTAVTAANFTGFISYANSNVCSGTPTPGATLASATQICLGTSVSFSLQNITAGTGVTYVWESSADGVTYTPIADAIAATYTVAPMVPTYYRAQVTCSGNTGVSTAVQVTFTNSVTASPVTRCGTGTVNLEAVGNAGATIKWYTTASGGLAIGTGSPFVSPSIAADTNFYVAAETASAGTLALGAGGSTSSSTAISFFPGSWGGAKTQYIIRATELLAAGFTAGNMSSLGFEPTNSGQAYQGFFVNIGHTANATAPTSNFIASGLTQVYAGSGTDNAFTPVANTVNTLNFGTGTGSAASFNWDGVSNIVISISWSSVPNAGTSSSTAMKSDAVGFVAGAYRQRDNVSPASMLGETSVSGTSSSRPRFSINGQVLCSSPRIAVAASVTVPPVLTLSAAPVSFCSGDTSTVVTLVSPASDYDVYAWSPATGVTGSSATGWTFNPTVTTTYTLTASQSAGTLCATTTSIVITVDELPLPITVTPSSASTCVGQIQQLTATGGNSIITLLNENFNAPTNGWTTVNNSTGTGTPANAAWTLRPDNYVHATYAVWHSNDNSQFYLTNSDAGGNGSVTATLLQSPSFSTVGYVSAELKFFSYLYDNSATSTTAKVQASLDGTAWTDLQTLTPVTTNAATNFTAVTIPLTAAFVNQPVVYVRFNYAGTWRYFWGIDNVSVSASKQFDLTWSPAANLYTDASATTPYVADTNASTVYFKSTTAAPAATYTVTSESDATCVTTATVDVIVNALPSLVINNPVAVCSPATVDLTASAVTAGSDTGLALTYWTDAAATVAFANPSSAGAGTYYIKAVNASTCSVIESVTVTVNALPSLVVTNPAAVCSPSTVDLTAAAVTAGSDADLTLTYWADPNGTVTFPAPEAITSSGTFYIKAMNANGCSVISPVAVVVNVVDAPTGDATQSFDEVAEVADLVATGAGVQWYDAATAGNLLADDAELINGGLYYASQTVGGCESQTRFEVTVSIVSTVVDYANLQFPGTQTINQGGSFDVYAKVFDAGTTEAAGASSAISAWIGYSSTDENPNSASFTWIPATFNVQNGDDDEYTVALGATLPVGTYYYASRFQVNSGDYAYGGYSSTGGGFWDGTANVNGVLTVQAPAITYANVQFPGSATVTVGGSTDVYAQVYAQGVTETAGAGTGITAWIGYSSTNENPNAASFTWVPASFNVQSGNNDEFSLAIGSDLAVGTYYYASRFQLNGGAFVYGGYSGTNGGFWNGTTNVNGVLTVACGVVDAPTGTAVQDFTGGDTLEDFTVTGENIIWYDAATDGNVLPATTVLVSGVSYYASQTVGVCESATRLMVTAGVDLRTPGFDSVSLKYYPNPVSDILTITYSHAIESVEVFNVLGQRVYQKAHNTQEVKIDMSSLATGNYIVNVMANGLVKNIKVIKK
ncbi:MAG: T9SS type A sorting domain-containing protein [Sphingobacteriales bacterium]|nr:MAG: T9SS type A sorting domain-containing protein [Sphingobacteriales bacterium]